LSPDATHRAWVGLAIELVTRLYHCLQVFTEWGGAAKCNVIVIAGHGVRKFTEQYFLRELSDTREMQQKPVLGESCSRLVGMCAALIGCCMSYRHREILRQQWAPFQHVCAGITDLDGPGLQFIENLRTGR
jgi:hypothetical protein